MSKTKKIIFAIIIVAIIVFAIMYIVKTRNKKIYTSINDFESVEEVLEYLDCKYLSENTLKDNVNIYMVFKHKPYEDKTSYEKFYEQLMGMIAQVINFKDFTLVDNTNNIKVEVTCDEENLSVSSYKINGSKTYFADMANSVIVDNYENKEGITSSLNSNVLNECIKNDWNYNSVKFGSYESTFQNYYIYFDEGLKVKEIEGKIFNIVFTTKYKSPIINNLSVGSDFDNVINTLGEPTYGNKDNNLIGYKTDDYYIFFTNNEISVYRVEKYDTAEFAKIVETFLTDKKSTDLASDLAELWPDYDELLGDQDGKIRLKYSLKGIKVQFNVSNEHGIILYDEFVGNITPDISLKQVINKEKELPQYVYIKNTSLIYETEQARSIGVIYDDYADSGSDKFVAIPDNITDEMDITAFNVLIISQNGDYPNSEITELVNSKIWLDDENLAYGVTAKGIYVYNAMTRKTRTVVTGDENFVINSYKENILSYDDTNIKVEI